jgi:hypothetical protein
MMWGHHVFGRNNSAQWTEYFGRLQDVYAAYNPRNDSERIARETYLRNLQSVVQRGINSAGQPEHVANFVLSLSGAAALQAAL